MPSWLKQAVFYEIYPQSFADSNEDGIGDINGMISKLDYIRGLGCNAIWVNPCFDSPFKDAGYDVRDYKKVAPRYGSNEDLYRFFGEAHNRGMHVILDLVPGHTSEEHRWFRESCKAEKNAFSGRYIWTRSVWENMPGCLYVSGEAERDGVYMLNFFKCQPALNYGWLHPERPWQKPMDDPDCLATVEAMKDVMRFWLDHGCDGFRVDMADSLVKGDDGQKSGTSSIWRGIRRMLDEEYPEAAIVSEWSNPELAIPAGFHCDFYLNHYGNGYFSLLRDYDSPDGDHSYFLAGGHGDIRRFLTDYLPKYQNTKGKGYISLLTCNHDTSRPARTLSARELKLAYAFLFTMPGVPFLYYGDEIGMRPMNLVSKEGGYSRTGTRTPMQWAPGKNLGFSDGAPDTLYLPVDPAPDAPTVAAQEGDPTSLLETVRAILYLRAAYEDLQADAEFEPVYTGEDGGLFVYRRGGLLLAVNPGLEERRAAAGELPEGLAAAGIPLFVIGSAGAVGEGLTMGPQSFAVWKI